MSKESLSAQGKFFAKPSPYPIFAKGSPTVIRSQLCEASYSSRDESQIKACKSLKFNKIISSSNSINLYMRIKNIKHCS